MAIAAVLAVTPMASARAQVVATARPAVTVYGSGEATAPAETASVQILIGQGGREFGFFEDEAGGSGFESGGSFEEFEVDAAMDAEAPPGAEPEASPVAVGEPSEAKEGRRGRRDRPERTPITAERLQPVVDAITAGAGIEPETVEIDLSPLAVDPFAGRQESVRLDFEVAAPTPDGLAELIAAASDAATDNGMVIEITGVLYNPADCALVEAEAAQNALADAREQADDLAELLGVTLGGVIGASGNPYFGFGPEAIGCSGQGSAFYESSYGGLGITAPLFDPSEPAEVEVYTTITVSYEIVEGEPA